MYCCVGLSNCSKSKIPHLLWNQQGLDIWCNNFHPILESCVLLLAWQCILPFYYKYQIHFCTFFSDTFCLVGFHWSCNIRSSCFLFYSVVKTFVYTKLGTRTNCSISGREFFEVKFFELWDCSGCWKLSNLNPGFTLQKRLSSFVIKFCHVISSFASQFPFQQSYCILAAKPKNLVGQKSSEWLSGLQEKVRNFWKKIAGSSSNYC